MFNNDPRKQPARRQFLQLMREHFGVTASEHYDIPYQDSTLSAYRFTPLQPKGTILLCGGFDSYIEEVIEEVFSLLFFLRNAGFDVIGFEGPGQGVPLEEAHLPMTSEWEKPVKAVLDYFQLDDVTLIGCSMGGCLAVRAAAYEPRVRRVITDDILTDFFETVMGQVSATVRTELSLLLKTGAAHAVNLLFERAMKQSLVLEWGIQQGMHVTGTTSPYEFLKQGQLYRTDDVSALVEQDVLLLVAAEDHYAPLHQFYDQIRLLSHVHSLTARLFTRQEQAQNHYHVGNIGLSLQVMTDWIESIQSR